MEQYVHLVNNSCLTKYNSLYGFELNSSRSECYNPKHLACFNNSLCPRSQTCNRQCLPDNQVCVNNVTVCNVSDFFFTYETNQIQLCNDVCYDSAIQKCTNGTVQCIDVCENQCYNPTDRNVSMEHYVYLVNNIVLLNTIACTDLN